MSNFKSAPTGMVLAPAQNQVIQFTDESGDAIQISQQDVYQYICDKATPQEVVFFMELCRSQRLNPFKKEAFLIKFGGNPASMITAEVVFERRANAHPSYRGMEHGVVYLDRNGEIRKREGTATYRAAGETLIGGWACVHRSDRKDAYAEVSLDEYNKNQSVWKTMPGVMISKCAKATALRLAFPSDFQGMYLSEEMGVAPDITEVHAEMVSDAPESQQQPEYGPETPTPEQQSTFNELVANLASLRDADQGDVAMAVLRSKSVAATGYSVGDDMTAAQMDAAIAQARAWVDKAAPEELFPDDVEYVSE
jgi:phage recombination protein Bet